MILANTLIWSQKILAYSDTPRVRALFMGSCGKGLGPGVGKEGA